jgi:D-lyxose ketol-isomerase
MVPHPVKSDVWGLKNTSGQTWMSVAPSSGSQIEVASGKSVSLLPGLRIRFGASEGTVL